MTAMAPAFMTPQKAINVWGRVGQHDGNPVARLHAAFTQRCRHCFGQYLQLAVRNAVVLENNRIPLAVAGGSIVKNGAEPAFRKDSLSEALPLSYEENQGNPPPCSRSLVNRPRVEKVTNDCCGTSTPSADILQEEAACFLSLFTASSCQRGNLSVGVGAGWVGKSHKIYIIKRL